MLTHRLTPDSNIEHIWQLIWRLGFYRGGPIMMSALSGVDIALWDLKGLNTWNKWIYKPITNN